MGLVTASLVSLSPAMIEEESDTLVEMLLLLALALSGPSSRGSDP